MRERRGEMPEMSPQSFSAVRERLDQIAEEVAREDIALDDALALYEEAVKLGLRACDLSEADLGSIGDDPQEEQGGPAEPASGPGSELG